MKLFKKLIFVLTTTFTVSVLCTWILISCSPSSNSKDGENNTSTYEIDLSDLSGQDNDISLIKQ